jgi:hypothetical protein
MDEFAGDPDKLVADVDCTSTGKPLCDANGVKGYPTLKYGDPADLEDYKGGRAFADLKKHVETKLVPSCSPSKLELCSAEKKAEIEKFQAMSAADLQAFIDEKAGAMEAAEAEFKKGVEGLQKSYEAMQAAKESTLEDIKESGLGIAKAVSKAKAKAGSDEL